MKTSYTRKQLRRLLASEVQHATELADQGFRPCNVHGEFIAADLILGAINQAPHPNQVMPRITEFRDAWATPISAEEYNERVRIKRAAANQRFAALRLRQEEERRVKSTFLGAMVAQAAQNLWTQVAESHKQAGNGRYRRAANLATKAALKRAGFKFSEGFHSEGYYL